MGDIEIIKGSVPDPFVRSTEPRIKDLELAFILQGIDPIQNEDTSKVILVDREKIRDDQDIQRLVSAQDFLKR